MCALTRCYEIDLGSCLSVITVGADKDVFQLTVWGSLHSTSNIGIINEFQQKLFIVNKSLINVDYWDELPGKLVYWLFSNFDQHFLQAIDMACSSLSPSMELT